MKANVGSYDAAVRFVLGCVILRFGIHHESWWALAGVALIVTTLLNFCVLYVPFHLDTTFTDRS